MREKLIDLMAAFYGVDPAYYGVEAQPLADHLIANGVTFAEDNNVPSKWIPVTERLPEEWTDVLVWSKCGFCVVAVSLGSHGKWRESWTHMMIDDDTVTHWMPLPEPPKGE